MGLTSLTGKSASRSVRPLQICLSSTCGTTCEVFVPCIAIGTTSKVEEEQGMLRMTSFSLPGLSLSLILPSFLTSSLSTKFFVHVGKLPRGKNALTVTHTPPTYVLCLRSHEQDLDLAQDGTRKDHEHMKRQHFTYTTH